MQIQSHRQSHAEAREQMLTTYAWSFRTAEDGFDLLLHFSKRQNTRVVAVIILGVFAFFLWQIISMAGPGLRNLITKGQAPSGPDWFPIAISAFFLASFLIGVLGPGRTAITTLLRGARVIEFRYQGFTSATCLLTTAPTELQIVSDGKGAELRAIQSAQMIEIARFGGPYPAQRLASDIQTRCPSFRLTRSE